MPRIHGEVLSQESLEKVKDGRRLFLIKWVVKDLDLKKTIFCHQWREKKDGMELSQIPDLTGKKCAWVTEGNRDKRNSFIVEFSKIRKEVEK